MSRQDLRTAAIIAAVCILGMMASAIYREPVFSDDRAGMLNAVETASGTNPIFAPDLAPKHGKLPARWAHKRWSAF